MNPANSAIDTAPEHAARPQLSSEPKYFSGGSIEKELVLTVNLNLLKPGARQSVLSIFDVTNLKNVQPKITINHEDNTIKIVIAHSKFSESATLEYLVSFVEKIQTYGIYERYENLNALWFYNYNNGGEILKFKNYPIVLQQHLKSEHSKFSTIIQESIPSKKYNLLVEVGCGGELENFSIAQNLGLGYLGIEFSVGAAQSAQRKIASQNLPNASVICEDILKITADKLHFPEHTCPIFIFPFNLLGNIAPISLLFSKLRLYSYDFIVSIYCLDEATNKMRLAYYQNCGYKDIMVQTDPQGNVIFSSKDGLYSVAYQPAYLENLLAAMGFEVKSYPCAEHGILIHAHSSWKPAPKPTITKQEQAGEKSPSFPQPTPSVLTQFQAYQPVKTLQTESVIPDSTGSPSKGIPPSNTPKSRL